MGPKKDDPLRAGAAAKIASQKGRSAKGRDLDLGLGFEFMPDLTLKPGALRAPGQFS